MQEHIGTADICDSYTDQVAVATPGLQAYGGLTKAAGPIHVIKMDEDNSNVWALLETPGLGRILIVDNSGQYCAVFGDRMATLAVNNGWQAVVVNGFVRDVAIIEQMQLGLWALGSCPYKCQGKTVIEPNGTAKFLGLTFSNGQYAYIDSDGLLLTERQLTL